MHKFSSPGIQDKGLSDESKNSLVKQSNIYKTGITSKGGRLYANRRRISQFQTDLDILRQNECILTYWADLTKPNKPMAKSTINHTLLAARRFLFKLNRPISPMALDELVQFKRDNPKDHSLETKLKLWKAEATTTTAQCDIGKILGIFRRNYAPLDLHIHIQSNHKTIPISEPVLRAIRTDETLTHEEQDAIDLMTYGAERITALNRLPLSDVHLVENSDVAILDVPARLAKTGLNHPSIIPKRLAERLLEKATKLHYSCLIPNHHSIWRRITKLAASKYHVRLTSHYFRKRFETLAERIPANEMNPNHWIVLMGSKPTLGHMPDIYSLLSNSELIHEYETYLMPRLALSGMVFEPHPNQLEQLRRENVELKEQLIKLTRLLTEARPKL